LWLRPFESPWSSTQEQRQALDLLNFVNLLPHKDTPASNLSYGQKKLLELALILVARPVEHNMEFVMRLCHTVNVMHRGTKIAEGPPYQVSRDPVVLDAYLGA
jgi:ABC-type branched-subunit amino acid transport system ATPase component